jgi:rhodanese-related sulfurtransferase
MVMTSNKEMQNQLYDLKRKVDKLENHIQFLESHITEAITIEKYHLMRIKNGDELSDDFIVKGLSYLDLSPEKAFNIYNQKDRDFILLDVSVSGFEAFAEIPEAKKIPLEDLERNTHKIPGRHKSILVISEDGVRSIQACKKLSSLGYYNLSNISGGYKYWPGFREMLSSSPSTKNDTDSQLG